MDKRQSLFQSIQNPHPTEIAKRSPPSTPHNTYRLRTMIKKGKALPILYQIKDTFYCSSFKILKFLSLKCQKLKKKLPESNISLIRKSQLPTKDLKSEEKKKASP